MTFCRAILLLLLSILVVFVGSSNIASVVKDNYYYESNTTSIGNAQIRYHYYSSDDETTFQGNDCRSNLILLGVGTAMTVKDYDEISKAILRTDDPPALDKVVVIVDSKPNSPIKLNPQPFADAVNNIVFHADFLPLCKNSLTVLVGGHSASGSAAFQAVLMNYILFPLAGFIGLDPYRIRSNPTFNILQTPGLYWGFSQTTCAVEVSNAAAAAYQRSTPKKRAFFQIQNNASSSCPYSHCAFTDTGCLWVCPLQCSNQFLLEAVAVSIEQFLRALASNGTNGFSRQDFNLSSANFSDAVLFVDETVGQPASEEKRQEMLAFV